MFTCCFLGGAVLGLAGRSRLAEAKDNDPNRDPYTQCLWACVSKANNCVINSCEAGHSWDDPCEDRCEDLYHLCNIGCQIL
jgi:hypothetical protein